MRLHPVGYNKDVTSGGKELSAKLKITQEKKGSFSSGKKDPWVGRPIKTGLQKRGRKLPGRQGRADCRAAQSQKIEPTANKTSPSVVRDIFAK